MCNLEGVLYYHLECPDYLRKFDDPQYQTYLRRQIFNIMAYPYYTFRTMEYKQKLAGKPIRDISLKDKYIEYPEEINPVPLSGVDKLLGNQNLRSKFLEGVEFEKDPPKEE
jgi:hypothetical protein